MSLHYRPDRTRIRTPQIYSLADFGTEVLIYFTILWGPWAFGSVHDWAILTMNLANYGIGALLLAKWAVRYKTDYYPPRWTSQKNSVSIPQPLKTDWRTKAVAALTIYMLSYIIISILNVRATFNYQFNFFEYEENYIKWLPHTYEKSATTQSFLNFLGLACCFWGIRDWLLGKTSKERMNKNQPEDEATWFSEVEVSTPYIPIRLNRLLWLLCISGGLLALIGIIQRLDGTPKLLWIYERARFGISTQSFGPFGYRSNGASYLNMILPVCIGFLMWAMLKARSAQMQTGRKSGDSQYILIPSICLMFTAPFVSLSRGSFVVLGFLVMLVILLILFKPKFMKGRQRLGMAMLIIAGIALSYYIGWESLFKRFSSQNPWHETQIIQPNTGEKIIYETILPPPPYDRNFSLFVIANSKSGKFQKGYLKTTLYKNGNLRILLYNNETKSHVNTTFTNLSQHLTNGKLALKITRGAEGLHVKANEQRILGIERSTGKTPPSWNHPIIPSEVYVKKRAVIKTGFQDLESRFLIIEPIQEKNMAPKISGQSIEIDLTGEWNLSNISELSSSRARIYRNSWRMATVHQWLGWGSGVWGTIYFLYRDADEKWEAWLHCDWLEYWITLGMLGAIPGFMLLGLAITPNRGQLGLPSVSWMGIGLNLAIAGCLFHALFDFPLQVISIMHLFVIICAIKMVIIVKS